MEHEIELVATEGMFHGLSKQNMLFHQCICELVDNAIAATGPDRKFRVDIVFLPSGDNNSTEVLIADNGKGMSLDHLKKALQLGESATINNRLNEHGFGLKNALATLSGGNGSWKIWSRCETKAEISSVQGPFRPRMTISDNDSFPNYDSLPTDIATLVKVPVTLRFLQTLQGRGAPAKNLSILRDWLIEHLGVLYRGFLEQDEESNENSGVIVVSIGNDSVKVPPIPVPFGNYETHYIDIALGGAVKQLQYRFGTLDEVKRDKLVRGKRAKFYYQQNIPSQGVDIRLGKRVIATRQFETIWKTDNGESQLSRHNGYNDFIGELLIPEVPRGVLTTVNTKTDFNLDDPDWASIFSELNRIRPRKGIREQSETELRHKWLKMLKATNPEDSISDEISVWPTGTAIDIYRKTATGRIVIYELKVGNGAPIHLYQLKMYWDGLVIDKKEQPSEAVLLVSDFNTALEEMANLMNSMTPPEGSKPYNFKIERLSDKGL